MTVNFYAEQVSEIKSTKAKVKKDASPRIAQIDNEY